MMTEKEKSTAGMIYNPVDENIMAQQLVILDKLYDFNHLRPSQLKEKELYMKNNFAECGDDCYIELPFHANWGGKNVHFGNGVYANFGLTMVDDGDIFVGDNVMFAPNVTVAAVNHPILPELRARGMQYNRTVRIGNNVWVGANAVILPGVTIGDNTVIGAGSVVTKDIPDNVVAFGNPCRVIRTISEHDREYYYKSDRIDWDEIQADS